MNIKSNKRNLLKNISPLKLSVFIILILYSITILGVLGWGILTSFKSVLDFTDMRNLFGLPDSNLSVDEIRFGNYATVWKNFTLSVESYGYYSSIFGSITIGTYTANIVTMILNTIIYAGLGSLIQTIVTMTMGYMCATYKNKISSIIYAVVLFSMTLHLVGGQPSEISMMMNLGLYNSYFGMFAHKFQFTGMYFLIFHAFFSGMASTYTEAAEIDGASQLRIYISIIMPLAAKMMGTIFLLLFIGYWNDYQTPLLYYPSFPTLAYGVFRMTSNTYGGTSLTQGTPQRIAGCVILFIPVIIIFISFKDIVLGNVSMGGLKE